MPPKRKASTVLENGQRVTRTRAKRKSAVTDENGEEVQQSPDSSAIVAKPVSPAECTARKNLLNRLKNEAVQLQQEGSPESLAEAIRRYDEIVHKFGEEQTVYVGAAECWEKVGNADKQLDSLRRAAELTSENDASDYSYDMWTTYFCLARRLQQPHDELLALRSLVDMMVERNKDKNDDGHFLRLLRRLVDLLEAEKDFVELRNFQHKLIGYEQDAGSPPKEILTLSLHLSTAWINTINHDYAVDVLRRSLSSVLLTPDYFDVPRSLIIHAIMTYGQHIVLAAFSEFASKPKTTGRCRVQLLVDLLREAERLGLVHWSHKDGKMVILELVRECSGFTAMLCIALMKTGQQFGLLEDLVENIPKMTDCDSYAPIIVLLARTLLEHEQSESAKMLMENFTNQKIHGATFCTEDGFILLGDIHQSLDDLPAAKYSYRRALDIRPSNRMAKTRLSRLEADIPNRTVVISQKSETRNLELQLEMLGSLRTTKKTRNRTAFIQTVQNLLNLTLEQYSVVILPAFYLSNLKTPFTLERALKSYTVPSPLIDAGHLDSDELFRIVMKACEAAFKLEMFEESLNISFLAIRHTDLYHDIDKLAKLKTNIAIASHFLLADFKSCDPSSPPSHQFCLEFLRGDLNRLKSNQCDTFGIHRWNLYYSLAVEEMAHETKTIASRSIKWGTHFLTNKGFEVRVAMIVASDAMNKGSLEKAYKMNMQIVETLTETLTPWSVWLNLGILSVNMALRYDCPPGRRHVVYSRGMLFLEKYGKLRGTECPEVLYNKARAAQNYGDVGSAVRFYGECLNACRRTIYTGDRLQLDLTFQAAYNLRALYCGQYDYQQVRMMQTEILCWKNVKKLCSE